MGLIRIIYNNKKKKDIDNNYKINKNKYYSKGCLVSEI
jgi:hypothetical protein